MYVWRSEAVCRRQFSFHHLRSWDRTEAARLGEENLYQTTGPSCQFHYFHSTKRAL